MSRSSAPRRLQPRAAGFTLIEIMAVMAIIAVMMLAVIPALDGMLPSYRLSSDARKVAATAELAQGEAVSQRKPMTLAYDLDNETYWIILPKEETAQPEDGAATEGGGLEGAFGNLGLAGDEVSEDDIEHGAPPPDPADAAEQEVPDDFADRDALSPTHLGDDVEFEMIVVGDEEKRSGTVYVPFDPLGTTGSHLVALKLAVEPGEEPISLWVKFNAMTRTIEYADQKPELRVLAPEGS